MICNFFFFSRHKLTTYNLTQAYTKSAIISTIFFVINHPKKKKEKKERKKKEGECDTNARRCRKCKKFPRDRRRQAEFDSHKADPK